MSTGAMNVIDYSAHLNHQSRYKEEDLGLNKCPSQILLRDLGLVLQHINVKAAHGRWLHLGDTPPSSSKV